jgi:hypothetical protein
MRRFLILTGREIRDHAGYFIASAIMSALLVALLISLTLEYYREVVTLVSVGVLIPLAVMLGIALCAFGAAQMRLDRTRNLSAFLTALPVSRGQIFLARVLVGVLGLLLFLVPLTITAAVLIDLWSPAVPLYRGLLPDLFAGVFLTCLACYSLGLYAGWSAKALVPTLGALLLVTLVPLLLAIKGFGAELVVILLLFVTASLAGTWDRFSSSSL